MKIISKNEFALEGIRAKIKYSNKLYTITATRGRINISDKTLYAECNVKVETDNATLVCDKMTYSKEEGLKCEGGAKFHTTAEFLKKNNEEIN